MRRLPRFRSGIEPVVGFAGTLHLGQGYERLQQAYADGSRPARCRIRCPCEVYCHTLTDGSILDPELRAAGYHTLTLFGMHTPGDLFTADPDGSRERAKDAALRSLQAVLAEPLQPCLALDRRGEPCVEIMTPLDIEAELGMPGGNIFHGDLAWPWLADDAAATDSSRTLGRGHGPSRDLAVRLRGRARRCGQWPRRPQRRNGRTRRVTDRPLVCVSQHSRQHDRSLTRWTVRFSSRPSQRPAEEHHGLRPPGFASVAHCAPLAQLAEQLTLNQRVGGSIPSRRTTLLVRGRLRSRAIAPPPS